MKVYVASAWQEYGRARAAHAAFGAAGIEITYDWTKLVEAFPNDDAPDALRRVHAAEDLAGVRAADVVLVLTPADTARGAGLWVELGAALALDVPLVIAGAQRNRNVFCSLAAARCATDETAIEVVIAMARALSKGIARRVASGDLEQKTEADHECG